MFPEAKKVTGIIPDRETAFGKAWRLNLKAIRIRAGLLECADASVASWVVEAPWAHPAWANYFLSLVHLRPTVKHPNPIINKPGATHEFFLAAIDPGEEPDVSGGLLPRQILHPLNFVGQLVCAGDIDAETQIEKVVEDILFGQLSPDTDYRQLWVARFGDDCLKK